MQDSNTGQDESKVLLCQDKRLLTASCDYWAILLNADIPL